MSLPANNTVLMFGAPSVLITTTSVQLLQANVLLKLLAVFTLTTWFCAAKKVNTFPIFHTTESSWTTLSPATSVNENRDRSKRSRQSSKNKGGNSNWQTIKKSCSRKPEKKRCLEIIKDICLKAIKLIHHGHTRVSDLILTWKTLNFK